MKTFIHEKKGEWKHLRALERTPTCMHIIIYLKHEYKKDE